MRACRVSVSSESPAVLDIGLRQPVAQTALADAEVSRDLRQRGVSLTSHGHDVVVELLGMGSGMVTSFKRRHSAPQIRCHLRAADRQVAEAGLEAPTAQCHNAAYRTGELKCHH